MILGILGPAGSGKDTAADHLVKAHRCVKVALADPLKRFCQEAYAFTDEQLWGPSSARNRPDERYPREHTWKVIKNEDGFETGWSCACCMADRPVGGPPSIAQCYLTTRYALQLLGTEWGRHCHPDTWANVAVRVAQRLAEGGCYYDAKTGIRYLSYVDGPEVKAKTDVVISDVRFKNEVKIIKAASGKVWRIIPANLAPGANGEAWRLHPSEAEQMEIPDSEFDAVIVNGKTSFETLYKVVDEALTL